MMGIASEIREAIVKRGGTPPSHGGIAASLDVLNKLNSGGGGSGGGGNFVVNVVLDADNAVVSADKTYAEIEAAVLAGQMPVARVDMSASSGDGVFMFANVAQIRTGMMIIFATYAVMSSGVFVCMADNTWQATISDT